MQIQTDSNLNQKLSYCIKYLNQRQLFSNIWQSDNSEKFENVLDERSMLQISAWVKTELQHACFPGDFTNFQKQPPQVFLEKVVLKDFKKFTGKRLCQGLFFNKVTGTRRFDKCETACKWNFAIFKTFITFQQRRIFI